MVKDVVLAAGCGSHDDDDGGCGGCGCGRMPLRNISIIMSNTFGKLFTLTTFGESHGVAIGGVVDGMPAGIDVDLDFIQNELARRRPGQSRITTDRKEPDQVELLSGIFEGKTTGAPIGFIVRNTNQHSKDYDNIRNLFRPSHADYTYYEKYDVRDTEEEDVRLPELRYHAL